MVLRIVERIKLTYGNAYGLEYSSKYNEGTTVRMKLPLPENKANKQSGLSTL